MTTGLQRTAPGLRSLRNALSGMGQGARTFAALLVICGIVAVVFSCWPKLDRNVAALFYQPPQGFVAQGRTIVQLRRLADWAPLVMCFGFLVAWGLKRLGWLRWPVPSGRGVAFLIASLLLGPGLLVNVGLKAHTHRPRPVHLRQFGGKSEYRPFYRFDGTCEANCSFVSGEVSTAAWTLAPAMLAPASRVLAASAAFLFAAAVALLRMAAGGHFLSDVTFSIVFTAFVVTALHRLFYHTTIGRPVATRHLVRRLRGLIVRRVNRQEV